MELRAKELLRNKKLSVYISIPRDEEKKAEELQSKLTALGFIVVNPFIIEKLQLFRNPKPTLAEKTAYIIPQLLRCDFVLLTNNWLGYEECQLEALTARHCQLPVLDENLQKIPVAKTIRLHISTKI